MDKGNRSLQLSNNKFKEVSPVETVERIKMILDKLGIETEETWFPENSIGTYSLRLNVKGSFIGSNGKGMSREYARASAYAEFIERLQNNKLQGNAILTTVLRNTEKGPYLYVDEKIMDAKSLAEEKNAFIEMFAKARGIDPANKEQVEKLLSSVQKMDYNILKEKSKFLCNPYYSLREQKNVYIPYFMANLHYGSNGMCAGNTRSEALVQGLSEVIERMVQKKIIMEQVSLPDIPVDYLKKHPSIYKMYQIIKEAPDYDILLKDCSMGGKYPVAAAVMIEKNTGRFGVKVGCHPDYSIALERLFTEATQGISLNRFVRKTKFDFYNTGVSTPTNLFNSYKTADAMFPYQLFSEDSEYEFVEPQCIEDLDNESLLTHLENLLLEEGYDILIHDVSYLGFPSYQVLVPGCSELNAPDQMYFEAENTRFHVQPLLNQPKYITDETCKYVVSVIKFFKYNLLENSMKNLSGCLSRGEFPAQELGMDQYYFLGMCYAYMGQYDLAAKEIGVINQVLHRDDIQNHAEFYRCMEQYLKGMDVIKDHQKVICYLRKLFGEELCSRIDYLMGEKENILLRQFASLDFQHLQEEKLAFEYLIFKDVMDKFRKAQTK